MLYSKRSTRDKPPGPDGILQRVLKELKLSIAGLLALGCTLLLKNILCTGGLEDSPWDCYLSKLFQKDSTDRRAFSPSSR